MDLRYYEYNSKLEVKARNKNRHENNVYGSRCSQKSANHCHVQDTGEVIKMLPHVVVVVVVARSLSSLSVGRDKPNAANARFLGSAISQFP